MYDKGKVTRNKELRVYENADEKENSQVIGYDAIMAPGSDKSHPTLTPSLLSSPILPSIISTPLSLVSKIKPNTNLPKKTRSGHISQPPNRYDIKMNTNVKVLLSQLIEVLCNDVPRD